MKMEQVSNNCFAVLNEKNRVCDANSGLINVGGGMVIDTQSDLPPGVDGIWMGLRRHCDSWFHNY